MAIFGTLKQVDIRSLWPKEAYDFTPWLAQNLTLLGDAIGIELELSAQESPVGSFSLDLLARDLGRDRTVIIENQVEQTDHDHLGKLLTYAAGHEASVIVWIASRFREEHRQALDWLNQRTDDHTEFFGVVVEAIQIDDSLPAPNFKLVSFPNDWTKTVNKPVSSSPSSRGAAYQAFFQTLIDELRTKHKFTNATKGQPQNWYTFVSGVKGVPYSVGFAQGGRVRVEAYIDNTNVTWNKWMFDELRTHAAELESQLGAYLEWERLDGKQASRIAVYRDGSIDMPPAELEAIRAWAIEYLLKFKQFLIPRAAQIAANPPTVVESSTTQLDNGMPEVSLG